MKFIDTKGREHSVDIRPSKWKRKEIGKGRGKFQSIVGQILSSIYPGDFILEEFPCLGESLYIDFFLPITKIAIEVQGKQHSQYNKFFHGSKIAFIEQQKRDKRKAEWCRINNIRLILIDYDEDEQKIISKIRDS